MARKNIIVYACEGSCTGDIRHKTADPGGHLYLVADGTAVTLTFKDGRNPFRPSDPIVTLEADSFEKKKLANVQGTFKYTITCDECPDGQDDGEFILEL